MIEKKIIDCPNCGKKIRVPRGKHIRFTCPDCQTELEFDDSTANLPVVDVEAGSEDSIWDNIIHYLSYFVAFPLFLVLHKILPDWDWKFHLDRILLFLAIVFIVEAIFNLLRVAVIVGLVAVVGYLGFGSISGNYGFRSLYKDYKHMVFAMINSPYPEDIIISKLKPFNHKSEILAAIDFNNPEVRNFALQTTRKYFYDYQNDMYHQDYRTIIQCFAVFKEINNNWNYVSDPANEEYFAKASESIKHLSGDCDDHTILMAACIKAIGGTPRLIHTIGHLYPELLIGNKNDLEAANYMIKRELFENESQEQKLYYHIDDKGMVWLNLDYTADYPGGRFMDEEILGSLTLN